MLLPLSSRTLQTTSLDLATKPLLFGLCILAADSHSFFQIILKFVFQQLNSLKFNSKQRSLQYPVAYIYMRKAIQNSLTSYFHKWVGKTSRIPLSSIPPLLSFKRGSGSCREWKKWERKESSWECSPNQINISISIPPCLLSSHRGYFSTLSWSYHQGHLPKLPSLFRLHLRADVRITLSATPHSSWIHGATQMIIDPLWMNSTTLILITLKLILLFICKRPHPHIYSSSFR